MRRCENAETNAGFAARPNTMANPELDIQYVAHLARVALTPEEEAQLGAQLGTVLEYFNQLKQLDVEGLEATAHAIPLTNVTRPDAVQPSLPVETALGNAPLQANGLFIVPKIVE